MESASPGLLEGRPADLEDVARNIALQVKAWSPDRLLARLESHEGIPTALRLESLPTFVDRPDMEGGDPDLIQLRTMLSEKGYTTQHVGLFEFISRVYNWSFISLSDSRSHPDRIPIQAVGTPTDYDPNVTGGGLPFSSSFSRTTGG